MLWLNKSKHKMYLMWFAFRIHLVSLFFYHYLWLAKNTFMKQALNQCRQLVQMHRNNRAHLSLVKSMSHYSEVTRLMFWQLYTPCTHTGHLDYTLPDATVTISHHSSSYPWSFDRYTPLNYASDMRKKKKSLSQIQV